MKHEADATFGKVRGAVLVLVLAGLVLSACSSGSASSTATTTRASHSPIRIRTSSGSGSTTTTARPGSANGSRTTIPTSSSLNVTPCNYVQAWLDNPNQFTEFATLAALTRKASNSSLQNDGKQLASAAAVQNTAAVSDVMGRLLATCRQLGLVRTVSGTNNTTS